MGFFTSDYMNARRTDLEALIENLQYKIGEEWADATITSKAIENNSIIVKASIGATKTPDTITGIRLVDANGTRIGEETTSISTSTSRNKLIVFTCPIQEV